MLDEIRCIHASDERGALGQIRLCRVQLHDLAQPGFIQAAPTEVGALHSLRVLEQESFRHGGSGGERIPQFGGVAFDAARWRGRIEDGHAIGIGDGDAAAAGEDAVQRLQLWTIHRAQAGGIVADAASNGSKRQSGIGFAHAGMHGVKERVRLPLRPRLNRDLAAGKHALAECLGGFAGSLVRVSEESYLGSVSAAAGRDQTFCRNAGTVVCAEQLHQFKAMSGEISGRNAPPGPRRGGIGVVAARIVGGRANAVTAEDDDEAQLAVIRGHGRRFLRPGG